MPSELQVRAQSLRERFRQAGRSPIVLEFAGLPKSGKTTVFLKFTHFCADLVFELKSSLSGRLYVLSGIKNIQVSIRGRVAPRCRNSWTKPKFRHGPTIPKYLSLIAVCLTPFFGSNFKSYFRGCEETTLRN